MGHEGVAGGGQEAGDRRGVAGVAADLGAYERLMRDYLLRVPGISSTKTSFLLTPVKNETALPLDV